MDKATRIQQLINLATKGKGASPYEAVTAATFAVNLAQKTGNGQLCARARVALHKASRRLERAA